MTQPPIPATLENNAYEPQGSVRLSDTAHATAAVLQAALACKSEADAERYEDTTDHACDALEGLEALRVSVESLHATGEWSHENARLTALALEGFIHAGGLGHDQTLLAQAHTLAGQEATAQVSLEALDSILQVMSDHVQAGLGKLKQSLLAALGNLSANLPHLEDKWRAMERRLHNEAIDKEAKSRDGRMMVSTSGLLRRFHRQGVWPEDIESYLKEYASLVEEIATRFDHQAQSAVVHNADALARIEFTTNAAFDETYAGCEKSWADPRKELTERAFEFITPGGPPLFISTSTTYKGENGAIKFFDSYATKHVPAKGRWGYQLRKIEVKDEVAPLSLNAMRELCKHFLDVTEKIKLEQHEHGEALAHAQVKAEFFAKNHEKADSDVKHGSRQAFKYIDKAYGVTYELGQFKYEVLNQFVSVSKALLTYMERSLKPYEVVEKD